VNSEDHPVTDYQPDHRNEILQLNRNDIHDNVWLVEGGNPQNKERHRIPLPKIARDIIRKLPEMEELIPEDIRPFLCPDDSETVRSVIRTTRDRMEFTYIPFNLLQHKALTENKTLAHGIPK
jgi:integrase